MGTLLYFVRVAVSIRLLLILASSSKAESLDFRRVGLNVFIIEIITILLGSQLAYSLALIRDTPSSVNRFNIRTLVIPSL